jgi:hypothetical protein
MKTLTLALSRVQERGQLLAAPRIVIRSKRDRALLDVTMVACSDAARSVPSKP